MSEHDGVDPLDVLGAANPIDANQMPSVSLARVSARIQEYIMSDLDNSQPARRGRRPFALAGLATMAAAIALVAIIGLPKPAVAPGPVAVAPTPTAVIDPSQEPISPGGGMAMCIAYSADIIKTFDFAFDGTVTAVDGDQITFVVNESYKGVNGDSVTLTNPDSDSINLGGIAKFEVGDHLLVTGHETFINACGFTQPYDADVAAEWAAALR